MKILLFVVFSVLCAAGLAGALQYLFPVVNLETPEDSICPPASEREAVRMDITSNVSLILREIAAGFNHTIEEVDQNDTTTYTVPECGGSGWRRVAFLNMTDPNQQCPDAWREYSNRMCGRQETDIASCDSVEYSSDRLEYTHICGRIIGYRDNSPDGYFGSHYSISLTPGSEINEPYVDGVSVTYGDPRQHIWTLYGSWGESRCCGYAYTTPPNFIEQNYFCDTSSPFWDGETSCSSDATCCAPHSGPWFNTTLTAPTAEDIEIRIYGDESTSNEDTPVEMIEIYVM